MTPTQAIAQLLLPQVTNRSPTEFQEVGEVVLLTHLDLFKQEGNSVGVRATAEVLQMLRNSKSLEDFRTKVDSLSRKEPPKE